VEESNPAHRLGAFGQADVPSGAEPGEVVGAEPTSNGDDANDGDDIIAGWDPPEPVAALPVTEAATPRFCPRCGSPWEPMWAECGACAAHRTRQIESLQVAPVDGGGGSEGLIPIRSAIALYFTLLGVSVLSMVATLAGASAVMTDIVASITFSAVVVIWCAATRPAAMVRLLRPAGVVWFFAALAAAVCTLAVAFGFIETLHRFVGVPKLSYSEPFLEAGYGKWVVFLLIAVQPAVFEELAFRGFVLTSLRPTLSDVEAVVVSAMLFMTLHISPAAFPHTLAMGLAAGFIRLRSRSLLPCMVMHFVHNSAVIAAEMYLNI
jgi:membrane protease YdiL (CAAX protease family)